MAGPKLETAANLQSVKVQVELISLLYSYVNHLKHSGHYMYRTVVTICIARLTFNNSTFCPHSAFVCFVWI
jgi:hypothetical protein